MGTEFVCWCECADCEARGPHSKHPIGNAEITEWTANRADRLAATDEVIATVREAHGTRLEETAARLERDPELVAEAELRLR